jgi:imidazole glycerol-phosphate synthase subunit HisF
MRPRIIPVLLLDRERRLVKTRRFGERVYVGDPFNTVRLFNEKEVDEICILDIDASRDKRKPDLGFVQELASECFMPVSFGGGIASARDCEALLKAGIEKFVVGTAAEDESLLRSMAAVMGSQAVVACVDYRGRGSGAVVHKTNGTISLHIHPTEFAKRIQAAGAGEIILQSVDRDGERVGLDADMVREVSSSVDIPLIALGGAGNMVHLRDGLAAGASAVASGSAFVFIGRLRAVLISYPTAEELQAFQLGT